ncbi:hypothetical protein [Rhizobium sp. RAF56]|uniref:hypothetical protein n=1 Tax=Rhizobium sp. RAF56 TaxID=3233062 RepID=UPI003F982C70
MGLGAYHGVDDNDRRREIVEWFGKDSPEDKYILMVGDLLLKIRMAGKKGSEIYEFPGVGRSIYIRTLAGLINGEFRSIDDFPEWLQLAQSELAEWLRGAPKRKSRYFLDMAGLESYRLMPHARSDPRGQFE